MKRLVSLFSLIVFLFSSVLTKAQKSEEDNLSTFRFYPFQLVTSSLAFGKEAFSENKTRSTVFLLGVRYRNWKNTDYNTPPAGLSPIDQFNDWKGLTGSVERRFYIPAFRQKEDGTLVDRNGSSGVYFAPGLRMDYNQNKYDNSTYSFTYDNQGQQSKNTYIENKGTVNYLGIMPYMNLGMQFTIFEYMYIDIYAGGGIRYVDENVVSKSTNVNRNSGYFSGNGSGAIEELILKTGVQPNIGMAIGLKW